MATTRRYRATDKSKTAKPKKKVSKRAALIKKVEKEGKVKLRTDWSALYKKKPRMMKRRMPKEGKEEPLQSSVRKKPAKQFSFTAKEREMIKRIGKLNRERKAKKRKG